MYCKNKNSYSKPTVSLLLPQSSSYSSSHIKRSKNRDCKSKIFLLQNICIMTSTLHFWKIFSSNVTKKEENTIKNWENTNFVGVYQPSGATKVYVVFAKV